MRSLVSLLTVSLAAALCAVPAASAAEACPAVAVVAARGSDQNPEQGEYFGPQTYGEHSHSNGYEGPNLTALFRLVEERHPGTMDRVQVIGLDEHAYPAAMGLPPLAEEGEKLSPAGVVRRLDEVLRTHPLPDLARRVTFGVAHSVHAGVRNAPGVVAAYEAESGCRPSYVVAGYSQGAIIGTALERHLGDRLIGAIHIGSPVPRWVVTAPRVINYCLDGDFACDLTPDSALNALETRASLHASYFVQPRPYDAVVADEFARWVEGA